MAHLCNTLKLPEKSMDEAEFDKFAQEYKQLHKEVIGISGESADFFAEYKIKDTIKLVNQYDFPENLSILDFGSGVGESIPFFLKHLPFCQLTCLDVSRKSLDIASERFNEKAKFVHFDGRNIPLENDFFHMVFTACVFHHVPQNQHHHLIKEIFRILQPGGIFVVFEHNPYNFLTRRAVNNCPFDDNAVLIPARYFRNLLYKEGFKINKPHYRIFFPRKLQFLRPLEGMMTWIPLGAQYYICAQKNL